MFSRILQVSSLLVVAAIFAATYLKQKSNSGKVLYILLDG